MYIIHIAGAQVMLSASVSAAGSADDVLVVALDCVAQGEKAAYDCDNSQSYQSIRDYPKGDTLA